MSSFWNERYGAKNYVYGKEPNVFFAEQIDNLIPGMLILPCEGEGRNAVYAATKGWDVEAFDLSVAGKSKALQLAGKTKIDISYVIKDALNASYPENKADVVAFIYAHFPPDVRSIIHKKAISWLKPGGKMILEAFNTLQLKNKSGGPKDLDMLYNTDMLLSDFQDLVTVLIQNVQTDLREGKLHEGKADIVRYIGTKKKL